MADHVPQQKPMTCGFCGKTQREVAKLIASQKGPLICDECIELALDIIRETDPTFGVPKPNDIVADVDGVKVTRAYAESVAPPTESEMYLNLWFPREEARRDINRNHLHHCNECHSDFLCRASCRGDTHVGWTRSSKFQNCQEHAKK